MRTPDATDLKLLSALSKNHRETTVALAEQLFLSRNTVQSRLANLEASGAFLPYDRCINPSAFGYPLTAFTTVYAKQQLLGELAEQLAAIPEIVQAYGLSGPSDLLVRIACSSAEDLFRVNAKILECRGVERTETAFAVNEMIPYRVGPLLEALQESDPA
jgi:DNA-binding Lrp family transcriptional regulator